jgi:TatA/E family protein of Tat protein translocase
MGALTPAHLMIILVIALIVVGPGKLPEVGAAIGKSIREFQKASGGITDVLTGTPARPAPPPQAPLQAPQPVQPAPPPQAYYTAPNGYPMLAPVPVQEAVVSPVEAAPVQPAQTVPMSVPQPDQAVGQAPSTPKVD